MIEPRVDDGDFRLYIGDAQDVLADLPAGSVDCVVTSPPYLDTRPEINAPNEMAYATIFAHLARVVTGGMLWNVGRIWREGIEQLWWTRLIDLAADSGWEHWDTEVWIKPNGNPIHGKLLANRHEYTLAFGREGVMFNEDEIRVPYAPSSIPRLRRRWTNHTGVKNDASRAPGRRETEPHPLGARPPSYVEVYTGREKGNPHPTPMPEDLAEHLIHWASWPGQVVLDPFLGSGTTAFMARKLERRAVGIEREEEFVPYLLERTQQLSLLG